MVLIFAPIRSSWSLEIWSIPLVFQNSSKWLNKQKYCSRTKNIFTLAMSFAGSYTEDEQNFPRQNNLILQQILHCCDCSNVFYQSEKFPCKHELALVVMRLQFGDSLLKHNTGFNLYSFVVCPISSFRSKRQLLYTWGSRLCSCCTCFMELSAINY